MQLTILLFFQELRTPLLTFIANAASFCGELPIPLLVTVFIYWCVSKKKGIALLLSELSAISAIQVLKCIFRVPRPFMAYPDRIHPLRESTSTGYSFPSGHSTTAASFYGTLMHLYKNRTIAVISSVLIILVPLSRLYLGVHWPSDVIFGTLLGLLAAMYLSPLFIRAYESESSMRKLAAIAFPIAAAVSIISAVMLNMGTDERLLKDLMETAALGAGAIIGIYLERSHVGFSPAEKWGLRITALVAGLAVGGVIVIGIRAIPGLHYIGKALGNMFFGVWVAFLYPMLGKKAGLFR